MDERARSIGGDGLDLIMRLGERMRRLHDIAQEALNENARYREAYGPPPPLSEAPAATMKPLRIVSTVDQIEESTRSFWSAAGGKIRAAHPDAAKIMSGEHRYVSLDGITVKDDPRSGRTYARCDTCGQIGWPEPLTSETRMTPEESMVYVARSVTHISPCTDVSTNGVTKA